jgi:hypothetical protein
VNGERVAMDSEDSMPAVWLVLLLLSAVFWVALILMVRNIVVVH